MGQEWTLELLDWAVCMVVEFACTSSFDIDIDIDIVGGDES